MELETQDGAGGKAKVKASKWVFVKPMGDVTWILSIFTAFHQSFPSVGL